MIWNRKTRYTPYNEWPTSMLTTLKEEVSKSKWRMQHHIQPSSGLLNDPNGFSYFNGQWHLFYQVFPYGPVHGLKSWQHLTSDDLIDWRDEGLAIKPDTKYDSHGAYTGTALPVNDKLFIMYTGNVRNQNWDRQSYQNGAWMDSDNKIKKDPEPLIINAPKGYTTSIRDPYLIRRNDRYFVVIGAQTTNNKGAALVYESKDLKSWKFNGPLNIPEDDSGYMIECPNLVFIDNKPVMIFCPQGLDQSIMNYQNIYPNVYAVGQKIDLLQSKVTNLSMPAQLDDGFDVYATEAFNAPDGRALAISWVGLPEIDYPTDVENWAHCLSLVKELTLKDNHLYQNPVAETKQLRTVSHEISMQDDLTYQMTDLNGSFEMELTIPSDTKLKLEISNARQTGKLIFKLDSIDGQVTVDRSKTGNPFGQKYGQTRTTKVSEHKAIKIRLIIDVSVFECYVDNGYSVITGRFFLDEKPNKLQIESQTEKVDGTVWEWRK